MSDSWKVTLPCTRAEAEALSGDIPSLALLEPVPVLMTSEPDPSRPEEWRLDVYLEAEPDAATLRMLQALVPSAETEPVVERIADADWVTISQAGLEPIRAGRFFVHTGHNAAEIPAGVVPFEIDAGRAFGTGHHETTTGCLEMLDRMARAGARFRNIADVGTGTGLLAFAAMHLWRQADVIASDIDPVSIEVTAENAALNGIASGPARGALALAVAPGLQHRALVRRAPYDLLIANILAGPLIELSRDFAAAVAPGGQVILAGLMQSQADAVIAGYRRQGLHPIDRIDRGKWPTLRLRKRRSARVILPLAPTPTPVIPW
ncbi:50S ribosomal protein L11 methyltransferase [Sphingomonas sp. ID0503]|uniref:50S ribosomal protein L11 methyltransferase n=1 Tax=Sphingomonas sp. ID0503 TaxID=3399691 RepID=UPI003AFAE0BE